MQRREVIGATCAALFGVFSLGARSAFGAERTRRRLVVDDRPWRNVVAPLATGVDAKRAVESGMGRMIAIRDGTRRLRLVDDEVAGVLKLDLALAKTRWSYQGHRTARSRRGEVVLDRYRNNVAEKVYEREAMIALGDPDVREWFQLHAAQFRRLLATLELPFEQAWDARGDELFRRAAQLRRELDVDEHVRLVPGESSRLSVKGGTDESRGDEVDLLYDRIRDRYRLVLVAAPRGQAHEHLAAHSETLELVGPRAGSRRPDAYRLTRWKDASLGRTYTRERGGGHPRYARKEARARALLSLFPTFL